MKMQSLTNGLHWSGILDKQVKFCPNIAFALYLGSYFKLSDYFLYGFTLQQIFTDDKAKLKKSIFIALIFCVKEANLGQI